MKAFVIAREKIVDFMKMDMVQPETEERCICRRGEVLPFQILVEGSGEIIQEIRWEDFSDGKGNIIPGKTGRTISLQMRDDTGNDYNVEKTVEGRTVLWAYIEIPMGIPGGQYKGRLQIICKGGEDCGVVCRIEVKEEAAVNCGYDDVSALSRIKWFRSRKGLTPVIPKPFVPLQWDEGERTVGILGRRIVIGKNGLPEGISTYFDRQNRLTEKGRRLLKEPWRLTVTTDTGNVDFIKRSETVTHREDHLRMKGDFDGGMISLSIDTRIEFDGYCTFDMVLKAKEDCTISDISLETVLYSEAVRYFVGLGHQGGYFKEPVDFHWDGKSHQDSFWIGDINGGLRLQLKDNRYQKPNVNIYYGYKPLRDSNWSNGGKGGMKIGKDGRIRAYTGVHKIQKDTPLYLTAVLMITPLKPIDWRDHFSQRYYQSYTERTECQWRERAEHDGINVINIHHGTDLNPYINYPFYEAECLKAFTEEMHQRGVQVKIYNTIREMTTKMKEFPIIRSMGYEILEPSAGIMGATLWQEDARQWICEHYGADIIPAWRELITGGKYKGETDASVLTNGKSPLCNYYVEGLDWLVKHCGIDGIYIDDLSYDRNTMKRVRRVLDQGRGRKIDMHSWNHYEPRAGMTNSLNLYTELLPYVDRLWIGEGFDYDNTDPGYWMTEMSGIPYGLTADMLQNGGNFYRGLLFGETVRHGWSGDASDIWKLWDDFGIAESDMTGYWNEENPVITDDADVYTTCYRRAGALMICIASWAPGSRMVRLRFREEMEMIRLYAPEIPGRQEEREYRVDDAFPIAKNAGLVLIARLRR